jgi:DNA polymerase III alpha subunit
MWTETNTEEQLIQGVLKHGPDILDHCLCSDDLTTYIDRIHQEHLHYPIPPTIVYKTNWFIPSEYKNMNIEQFLLDQCPNENHDRLAYELELYRKNDMIPVLQTMKYIVDTLRKNNIVWGVGRGSSVASYVLFLLGVHKIDSVKYKLPIEEFFKGDQNG